jgi:hypothetical protein
MQVGEETVSGDFMRRSQSDRKLDRKISGRPLLKGQKRKCLKGMNIF